MQRDLAGRRVVVMGLGRFGGGVGAVRWLAEQGADVLLTDLASAESLAQPISAIDDLIGSGAVRLRLGERDEREFRAADLVVVSPAVPKPWENSFIHAAVDAGARLTTEIRLLVEHLPNRGRAIGVTGTAGKSTTAAMIAHILRELSPTRLGGARVWLGGNIGGSLLPRVAEIAPDDWVILELSSAQLYWLGDWFVGRRDEQGWSPHVAVVTNVMPNHLDWHGTFEHYEQCKRNITSFQSSDERGLAGKQVAQRSLSLGASISKASASEPRAQARGQDDVRRPLTPSLSRGERGQDALTQSALLSNLRCLMIPGRHNRLNAALALDAAQASLASIGIDVEPDVLFGAVRMFAGLPHRLQRVAEAPRDAGVIRAYNDSKSTTPQAAALAVQAFEDDPEVGARRVHLICGGYDKGVDLSPMFDAAAMCRGVYTIGATGPAIAIAVEKKGGHAIECGDLNVAVERAARSAKPGEVIVLSPGCASWDQFTHYEERGRAFARQVRRLLELPPPDESLFQMPAEAGPGQNDPKKTRTGA